jgi:hypothetical protein
MDAMPWLLSTKANRTKKLRCGAVTNAPQSTGPKKSETIPHSIPSAGLPAEVLFFIFF